MCVGSVLPWTVDFELHRICDGEGWDQRQIGMLTAFHPNVQTLNRNTVQMVTSTIYWRNAQN